MSSGTDVKPRLAEELQFTEVVVISAEKLSNDQRERGKKKAKGEKGGTLPLCSANGPLTEIYLFGERNPNVTKLDPIRKWVSA